jgi:predicted nucleic acid-binding protein
MARPVLADSCYYINLLRAGRDPLPVLTEVALTRELAVCGIVRCEVGRGIREAFYRQRFDNFWNLMVNVATDDRLWEDAQQTAWELDRKGVVLPLTDIVIACCAKRIGAVVLTFDKHFEQIPGLKTTSELI